MSNAPETNTPPETAASAAPPAPPPLPKHPIVELWGRYKAIFMHAWEHRHELAGPERMSDEAAFLPAALSLQETPIHPAPRRFAWAIMALFVMGIMWSMVGQVDIVATAPGRIIVSDRTKVIQPLEPSVVKAVLVKDGDHVKAGQVLIELDPTVAMADQASAQEQLLSSQSDVLRAQTLLRALTQGGSPVLRNVPEELAHDKESLSQLQAQISSEWQDIRAKLAKLDAEVARNQAAVVTVKESIAKLEATIPMAQARENDYKKLVDQGFISGHATQDKTRERIEQERDLNVQRARLAEVQYTAAESAQAKTAYYMETLRQLNDRLGDASSKYAIHQADAAKADRREKLTQLTAPVDGVIQQLAVHSVGGVVTSAQPVMIVVPDATQITAEVSVANQDIGFVYAGQLVEVKFETFNYTKYGTVHAQVQTVSADAVTDEKKGSYYPAILTLKQKDMLIDGKRVPISPGMNITAEIKTGKRRVIEFLMSKVKKTMSESLHER